MSTLERWIPLAASLRGYEREMLKQDLVAGLTTGIMLIPQAMAYAMLAGLEPIVGLYASTVPLVLYAVFGTSRQLAVGPVAMISLLVASAVAPLAGGDVAAYAGLAGLLALMVGVIQLGMGVVRLGFLVKFLSHPVIAGFTSAAALIIGLSQLKHVLGVPLQRSHHVHDIILQAIEHVGEIHSITLGISIASIAALVVLKKYASKFPRFLLVVAGGALTVWGLGLESMGVAIVGSVPEGLPTPALPPMELDSVMALLPMAFTISLVAFMESISVAKAFARKEGLEVDPDQELKGLGLANLAAGVLQGYPVTGGFSRTAVNAQAGAKTGVAALITALLVVITLMFLTPLFYFLPKGVLAAIIMTAVLGLIDVAEAKHLYKVSKPDLAMMGLTFVATLTLGIEQGILLGTATSLFWFIWNTSKPHVAELGQLEGTDVYRNVKRNPDALVRPEVLAVRIDGPLYFANTGFLKTTLSEWVDGHGDALEAVILDAKAISSIDATGAGFLRDWVTDLQGRGLQVWFAGVRGPVRDVLDAAQVVALIGEERFVHRVHQGVDEARPLGRLG
ncbi:MAG: sulfate permease [Rhodobacterales bacterium]|nr:sulfate permease [Rhodobacterales bacterium]